MGECKFCGEPLVYTAGKKAKQYCNAVCKQKYWQIDKKKNGFKRISSEEWRRITAELETLALFRKHFELPLKNIINPVLPGFKKMLGESGIDFAIRKAESALK